MSKVTLYPVTSITQRSCVWRIRSNRETAAIDLLYLLPKFSSIFYVNSLHRSSGMERPSREAKKRAAM